MRELISDYCIKTKYAFAGLPTSNAIAEIIASEFDALVEQEFGSLGVIFYSRYIDDSVLILNRHVDEREIRIKLDSILDAVTELEEELAKLKDIGDVMKTSFAIRDHVIPCMEKLRSFVDAAEMLTSGKYWPVPSYGKILMSI